MSASVYHPKACFVPDTCVNRGGRCIRLAATVTAIFWDMAWGLRGGATGRDAKKKAHLRRVFGGLMSETLVTPAGFPAAQHPRVTADSKKRIFMSKLCLAGGNLCSTLVNFMPTNNAVERRLGCASSPPTVYLTPLSPQVQKKWSSASPITTTYIPYNRCLDEFLDASSVGKTTPPPLYMTTLGG